MLYCIELHITFALRNHTFAWHNHSYPNLATPLLELYCSLPCPAIPRNAITVHILSALCLYCTQPCLYCAHHDLHHATFLSHHTTLLCLTFATHFIAQLFRCYDNLCYTTLRHHISVQNLTIRCLAFA